MSLICEAFGCTPDIALEQDPKLIVPILEFRLAKQAKDLVHPDPSKEYEVKAAEAMLLKHPEIVKFWLEITRAGQDG